MISRDLEFVGCRVVPQDRGAQVEEWASSSATSIGTEENSLGVPKAQDRALIYMRANKHSQSGGIQVQRGASSLSKYLYKKGDGHQEVSE